MKEVERVRSWLRQNGYDGVILSRRDNYTWVTGGNKNHVLSSTAEGVASLLITADQICVYADSSDAGRIKAEQNNLKAAVITVPWYEGVEEKLRLLSDGRRIVSDNGVAGTRNVQPLLAGLRLRLDDRALERYRQAAGECAEIVEDIVRTSRPGQIEAEIAGEVKLRCLKKGISPDCVLVGSDERITQYRHPMPTGKEIKKSLMIVLGGEKYGLYTSLTRMVYFAGPGPDVRRRYETVQYIFAAMQQMMRAGLTYREYFQKVQELYREAGCPEEWKLHHQGGPTGYGCREQIIRPDSEGVIELQQAYAWNPTITGVKCEDTTFLDKEGRNILLSGTKEWPRQEVKTTYGSFFVPELLTL